MIQVACDFLLTDMTGNGHPAFLVYIKKITAKRDAK
jgi:hypothetical protein